MLLLSALGSHVAAESLLRDLFAQDFESPGPHVPPFCQQGVLVGKKDVEQQSTHDTSDGVRRPSVAYAWGLAAFDGRELRCSRAC